MTDKDHAHVGPNEPLRQWCAQTLRVALAKEGISRLKLHQRLVERFGDRAPSQTTVYRLMSGEALPVRGHEKVPTGGQVEVSSFGRIKVSTPCSSCRSGTAGPDGDGEGANQSPSPSGSSIEICEGPHGHHFRLLRARVVPRCRR